MLAPAIFAFCASGQCAPTMPKRKDIDFASDLQLKGQLTLKAGCSKEWHIVKYVEVDGSTFIEVGKQVNWVCHVVCGCGRSTGPLKRTRVIENLRAEVVSMLAPASGADAAADGDDDDPMAALGMETPTKRVPRRRSGRKRQSDDDPSKTTSRVLEVHLPAPGTAGHQISVYVKDFPKYTLEAPSNGGHNSSLWIRKDCLPRFLQVLREEFLSYGVEKVTSAEATSLEDSAALSCCFDHRDGAFVVKQGRTIAQRFYVQKRLKGSQQYVNGLAYKDLLSAAREEAEAWIAQHQDI